MDTQVLVIGQIIIDIIMVGVVLWFVKFHYRQQINWQNHDMIMRKSEAVLADMKKISRNLEKNLEEKKILSGRLLEQLDEGMKKAEDNYRQISKIMPDFSASLNDRENHKRGPDQKLSSINALLDKGLSREEVSQHLDISLGEISLMLNLQPQKGEKG